jgi:hypothetical protein
VVPTQALKVLLQVLVRSIPALKLLLKFLRLSPSSAVKPL